MAEDAQFGFSPGKDWARGVVVGSLLGLRLQFVAFFLISEGECHKVGM